MRFFLDISLLLLIAVTIFSCWHKGFIRSVLGTAKTVISVVLTYMFGAKVSAFLAERVVGQRVVRYVHDRFLAMFEQDAQVFDLSRVMENLPDWLRVLFERTNADSASAGSDYANVTEASADKLYEMAESFARPISNIISDFLGYASVFLFFENERDLNPRPNECTAGAGKPGAAHRVQVLLPLPPGRPMRCIGLFVFPRINEER